MSIDAAFFEKIRRIRSTQHTAIRAAAGAWLALAHAANAESSALTGTARQAAGQPGVGLLELADRLDAASGWARGAGTVSQQIADQLQRAGERAARALERALELEEEFRQATEQLRSSPTAASYVQAAVQGAKERLDAEAQRELDELGQEFARVIGGNAPPAPPGGAPGAAAAPAVPAASAGGGAGAGEEAAAAAATAGPGASAASQAAASAGPGGSAHAEATPDFEAPNGSAIGSGSYPESSVLGPEAGDFAGWVQSPSTGHLVDPATGREFDPASGRWIDPVTGRPFGEVTEYATRLSGLAAGPGAIASAGGLATVSAGGLPGAGAAGPGGAAGMAGMAGLAGLYGGMIPPSIANAGAARQQVMGQAARTMGRRARVAANFALHEAARGGRPYLPPPAPVAAGGRGPDPGAPEPRRTGQPTALTEDPAVWSPRPAGCGVLGA